MENPQKSSPSAPPPSTSLQCVHHATCPAGMWCLTGKALEWSACRLCGIATTLVINELLPSPLMFSLTNPFDELGRKFFNEGAKKKFRTIVGALGDSMTINIDEWVGLKERVKKTQVDGFAVSEITDFDFCAVLADTYNPYLFNICSVCIARIDKEFANG
jgi:hypothetical protein